MNRIACSSHIYYNVAIDQYCSLEQYWFRMSEGKQQIKSWLNRVLRIVGKDGLDRGEQDCRWSPANGKGDQLELWLDIQVSVQLPKKRKTMRRTSAKQRV